MRNLLNVLYCQLNRIFYCERAEMGEYEKLKQVNFSFAITISGNFVNYSSLIGFYNGFHRVKATA